MKNYTYIGKTLTAFTIGEGETAKDYVLSNGCTTSLPEDAPLVVDMVTKKLLVETPADKKAEEPKTKK